MSKSVVIVKEDGSFVPLIEIEKVVIRNAIENTASFTEAAKQLGISRSTLYRKLDDPDYDLSDLADAIRKDRGERNRTEKATIKDAMLRASTADELCEILNMDRRTLAEKLEFHGLIFKPRTMSYTDRLAADRKRHEAAGTLLICV